MAEKRTIELEIQDNSKSLKAQYKEAVAELQRVSAAYGETSAEAIKAAKAAAESISSQRYSHKVLEKRGCCASSPAQRIEATEKGIV